MSVEGQTHSNGVADAAVDPNAGGGGGGGRGMRSMNLYVDQIGNMDDKALRELFAPFGSIVRLRVQVDRATGLRAGYGFVEFSSEDEAGKAIAGLNGTVVNGVPMKVEFKKPSALQPAVILPTNLYVANVPTSYSKERMDSLFAKYGTIVQSRVLTDPSGAARGVGFVRFSDNSAAQAAITALNNSVPPDGASALIVRFAKEGKDRFDMLPGRMGTTPVSAYSYAGYGPIKSHRGGPVSAYSVFPRPHDVSNYSPASAAALGWSPSPYSRPQHHQPPPHVSEQSFHSPSPYALPHHPSSALAPPILTAPSAAPDPYGSNYPAPPAEAAPVPVPQGPVPPSAYGQPLEGGSVGRGIPHYSAPSPPVPGLGGPPQSGYSAYAPPMPTPNLAAPSPYAAPAYMPRQGPPTLFVFHLPNETTEPELQQLFGLFGPVSSVTVMRDRLTGLSKGYAFVEMEFEMHAAAAVQKLNGYQIGTKFLKVSFKT